LIEVLITMFRKANESTTKFVEFDSWVGMGGRKAPEAAPYVTTNVALKLGVGGLQRCRRSLLTQTATGTRVNKQKLPTCL
jgi:hypothetical protein